MAQRDTNEPAVTDPTLETMIKMEMAREIARQRLAAGQTAPEQEVGEGTPPAGAGMGPKGKGVAQSDINKLLSKYPIIESKPYGKAPPPEQEQPGAWETLNTPVNTSMSDAAKAWAQRQYAKETGKGGFLESAKSGLTAMVPAAAETFENMFFSPLGALTTLMTGGEYGAAKAGLPAIARAMNIGGKVSGLPYLAHGGVGAFQKTMKGDLPGAGMDLLEAGMGALPFAEPRTLVKPGAGVGKLGSKIKEKFTRTSKAAPKGELPIVEGELVGEPFTVGQVMPSHEPATPYAPTPNQRLGLAPGGTPTPEYPAQRMGLAPGTGQSNMVVTPEGRAYGPNLHPPLSMRESLGSQSPISPMSSHPSAPSGIAEQAPPGGMGGQEVGEADAYIAAVKAGQVPSGMKFPDWQRTRRPFDQPPSEIGRGIVGDLPQFAKTAEGKTVMGGDIPELADIFTHSLYKGDTIPTATKELLQNAMDATKHLGPEGHIEVTFKHEGWEAERFRQLKEQELEGTLSDYGKEALADYKKKPPYQSSDNYVEVKDNGKGLTKDELDTVFIDLASSGKRDRPDAIGGFGVAKAAYLLGGEKASVRSVVYEDGKLLEHTFTATPQQIKKQGFDIHTRELPPDSEPTGTTVRTHVPTGKGFDNAKNFVRNLADSSTGLQGKISVNELEAAKDIKQSSHVPLSMEGGKRIDLSSPSADAELLIPKNARYADRNGVSVKVLNNGMYQNTIRYGGYETFPNVPDNIIINIKSKVKEGHADYPFTLNREALRGTVGQKVSNYIEENIIRPGANAREAAIKEAYDAIPLKKGVAYYDVGQKFTPSEFAAITEHPLTQELGRIINQTIGDIFNMTAMDREWRRYIPTKVGIIFDETAKGIHIPNPGTDESAILINPYQIMLERSPDQAAAGILHTAQHEVAHVAGGTHDEAFTIRLSEIVDDFGGNDVPIRRNIERLLSGGTGDYLPEVQEILSKYSEARGRFTSFDDPVYRTGVKSEYQKRGGKGDIPGDTRPPSTRAINRLIDALAEHKASREELDINRQQMLGVKFKAFERVKKTGEEGAKRRMSKLQGAVDDEELLPGMIKMSQKDRDALFDAVSINPALSTPEKGRSYVALWKLLEGDRILQPNEMDIIDRTFGPGTADQIMELHGGLGIVGKINPGKIANTMKTISASMDLSAPFRQGLGLVHRKEFWSSFQNMFKVAKSQEMFDALQGALASRPNAKLAEDSGLFLTGLSKGKRGRGREEAYLESYVEDLRKMGGLGKTLTEPVAASERAYTGFLNKLRADTFDSLIRDAEAAGHQIYVNARDGRKIPTDLTKKIAQYINTSTGRGSLGPLNKVGDELNQLFFSPRLIASRLTMLNPAYYYKMPPFARKEALKSLMSIAGFITTVNAAGSMMGGDIKAGTEGRTINPDFGKIRFGNTRLDPGAGFLQYIVAASQFIQGKAQSSSNNNIYDTGKFGQPGRLGKLAGIGNPRYTSFAEGKLSPMASLIDNLLSGRSDFDGKPMTVQGEIKKRVTPLIIQDLMEIYNEDPNLLGLGIPAALGMSAQTYKEREAAPMNMKLPGIGAMSLPGL